jgi:hypothetical protein
MEISNKLLERSPGLTEDDFRSNPMGAGGEDILLSSAARKLYPWNIEVKTQKSLTVERWYQQAKEHGAYEPVVMCRRNKTRGEKCDTPWYGVCSLDYLLYLNECRLKVEGKS